MLTLSIQGYAPLGKSDAIVVLATPTRVTFVMPIGELPENRGSSAVHIGGVYSTALRIKDVLHGEFADDHVTVNLNATSRENLSKAKTIVVVLSRATDKKLTALGWNVPRTLACIPSAVGKEEQEFRATFPIELPSTKENCVRLKMP